MQSLEHKARHAQLRACCSCFLAERSSDLHHQAFYGVIRDAVTTITTTTINGKPHVAHAAESVLPVTAAAAAADQLPRELRNE
jgi:hypothetical protein